MAKKSTLEYFVPMNKLELSGSLIMTDQSPGEITITDFSTGSLIHIYGTDFKVKGGELKHGNIEGFDIVNDQGKPMLSFTDLDIDAAMLPKQGANALVSMMFDLGLLGSNVIKGSNGTDTITASAGKDFITGRGGDDLISGGIGRDEMRGGGGADEFAFEAGDGKDRILDFDADGSDGKQDFIDANFFSIKHISKSGQDTILDFGSGDELTLVGIKKADIDMSDFV